MNQGIISDVSNDQNIRFLCSLTYHKIVWSYQVVLADFFLFLLRLAKIYLVNQWNIFSASRFGVSTCNLSSLNLSAIKFLGKRNPLTDFSRHCYKEHQPRDGKNELGDSHMSRYVEIQYFCYILWPEWQKRKLHTHFHCASYQASSRT